MVVERGQLTRLHDNNSNGEADFFENLCSDWHMGGGEHSYDTCLETDPDGNFYLFKTGDDHTPTGGCLLKIAKDGSKTEIFATGFRHPIGLGMSPDGRVSGADQKELDAGHASRHVQEGGFYGDMHAPSRGTAEDLRRATALAAQGSGQLRRRASLGAEGFVGPAGRTHAAPVVRPLPALAILPDGDRFQAGAIDLGLKFLSGVASTLQPEGWALTSRSRRLADRRQERRLFARVRYTGKPLTIPTDSLSSGTEFD